ncbi:diguanylate cyclase domain-containing protein [Marivita sp. S0852]|uniref:diguanylate cyclase domain-containing protein n=1 Tax=Marivita sp. S0852 TaxID=3373893 RepID=UPI00398275CE
MISAYDLLAQLRPLHISLCKAGHIVQIGHGFSKLSDQDILGRRFWDAFHVLRPFHPTNLPELQGLKGQTLRLHLRREPEIVLRGQVIADGAGGVIIDASFGMAVVDAVQRFGLTAQDFAVSDLAVELLFLQEAKSSAMSASFSLNARLDGARRAALTEAHTDVLTGLHNRRALDTALARLNQTDTSYAVLHLDLDRFKQVNDNWGHSVGDIILKHAASIIRQSTRQDDLLVRAGGDEFVIVCPGLEEHARLMKLSYDVIGRISEPLDIEGNQIETGASIGVASSDQKGKMPGHRILERADIALYAAKRLGRGQAMVWTPELGEKLNQMNLPNPIIR